MASAFGATSSFVPFQSSGASSSTTTINMGGQQMTFTGQNQQQDALRAMIDMLTKQLEAV